MKFLAGEGENFGLGEALTPLIDVIFLLLIFFLVSTRFAAEEQSLLINLAETKGRSSEQQREEKWSIAVDAQNRIFVNSSAVELNEVERRLSDYSSQAENIMILLRVDKDSKYEIVGKLVGLFSEYQYRQVFLQTVRESD